MALTKEQKIAYRKEYYSKNSEIAKERAAKWRRDNPEWSRETRRKWRAANKEQISQKRRARYAKNPEKEKTVMKEYRQKNRAKLNVMKLGYIKSTPQRKLSHLLRNRVKDLLKSKNFKKNSRFSDYLGCTVEQLVIHLEQQFKPGMTWDNHGGWHVDHIVPLSSASTVEEIYKLSHYSNLQPLWAVENMSKGAKILK